MSRVVGEKRSRDFFLAIALVLCVDLLYAFPYLLNWGVIADPQLPPFLSDDIYYYLNVSHCALFADIINPWFGGTVQAGDVPHVRFSVAPALFRTLEILLPERDVLALFLWNIFWTTAIAVTALWAVSCLSMKSLRATSLASVGFLLLVSGPSLLMGLHRWVRTGAFNMFFLQLPFYRSFYPQVAIPFLLGYVGLQVKAFRDGNRLWWVLLAGTQIATFVLFPYAALLMLCASLISIALQPLLKSKRIDWRAAAVSLGASTLGDVIAVILRSPRRLPGVENELPLGLDLAVPDRIFIAISALVFAAAVATFFLERRSEDGGDPTTTSLGLAFVAMTWTGDLIIAHGLNVSLHVGYLNHVVLALLFIRSLSLLERSFPSRRFQRAAALVAGLFLLHGVIASAVAGIGNLGESRAQRDLLQLLHEVNVGANDLVVTPSYSRTPEGEWIPLVTHSRILFHPDAQAFMSRIDEKPYWFRLALYLHLTGRDAATVERDFSQPRVAAAYVGPRDVTELSGRRRPEIIKETKQSLLSEMRGIEFNPGAVCGFFQPFVRVVFIEHPGDPLFDRQRLAECLDLDSSRHLGSWNVTVARRRLH